MILLVCVDDAYGMGFCRRRQSSDRIVTREILKLAFGKKLWVDPYSISLFPENTVCADKDFLSKAGIGDLCFAECINVMPWLEKAEGVVIFRWNRKYPSDVKFPHQIIKDWKLVERKEFEGYSHNKITMEVYRR